MFVMSQDSGTGAACRLPQRTITAHDSFQGRLNKHAVFATFRVRSAADSINMVSTVKPQVWCIAAAQKSEFPI
jgi:hypothetical protein